MAEDPTTQVLQRELTERRASEDATVPDERDAHERRAVKASYLSEKLAERAESERRIEEG